MEGIERLKLCYDDYFRTLELLPDQYSPSAGFLGFGRGPKDDPCHEQFYESLKETVAAIAQDGLSEEAAQEAVNFILRAEDENQLEKYGTLMLTAVQGQAIPLIPFLSREDAGAMLAWYGKRHPRHDRLPIQKQVCQALKRQAK